MAIQLNGWRRIALTLSTLWVCIATTTTGSDYFNKSDGYFVFQTIPVGTTVLGGSVNLPDGTTITRDEQTEFEQRLKAEQGHSNLSGKAVPPSDLPDDLKKPWERDWSKQAGVPTASEIRWSRLLFVGVAMPLLLWIFAELCVRVVRWISYGFKQSKSRPDA